MREIKFRITLTNHLGKRINLINHIIEEQNGSIVYENNKGYASLDFVTNGVYYDPSIVGDDVERIEVKWQVDGGEVKKELFCIEAVEYLGYDNIKVYCRSKTFFYQKTILHDTINANDLHELLRKLLPQASLDLELLTNHPFYGALDVQNKSAFEAVEELRELYRFEYSYKEGVVRFCDKRRIRMDDMPTASFNEIEDIEEISTSTELFKKRIRSVEINPKKNEEKIEASLKLRIEPSPQPCGPDETLVFVDDDGKEYKITPKRAAFYIYYSPNEGEPICNLPTKKFLKPVVEKYALNDEDTLRLSGHIAELVAVEGAKAVRYEDNVLIFDKKYTGEVKISYTTNLLVGSIENSKYPKKIPITITHKDRIIKHIHSIELDGYYPIPYTLEFSLISDFGFRVDDAINVLVQIYKYDKDTQAFVEVASIQSDAFGDFEFRLQEYCTYKIVAGGEGFFLDYYINKMDLYAGSNKMEC